MKVTMMRFTKSGTCVSYTSAKQLCLADEIGLEHLGEFKYDILDSILDRKFLDLCDDDTFQAFVQFLLDVFVDVHIKIEVYERKTNVFIARRRNLLHTDRCLYSYLVDVDSPFKEMMDHIERSEQHRLHEKVQFTYRGIK